MISTQELAEAFRRNLEILQAQTKGLTHADSLIQPPVRGNCLNWVVGHIAGNRNGLLTTLGEPAIMTEAQAKRYGYGSEPVCGDGDDILRLEEMLQKIEASQATLEEALGRLTPEDLAAEKQTFRGQVALGNQLFFLYFHETFHVGQTELLRQLAGTNDKVI